MSTNSLPASSTESDQSAANVVANSDAFREDATIAATPGKEVGGGSLNVPPDKVFEKLLNDLGDHHGLIIGPYHVADLPFILIDDGIDVYFSASQLEAAGKYTLSHPEHPGHPVRTDTHAGPALDLSITNFVFFQFLGIAILLTIFKIVGNRYKKDPLKAPRGIQNAMEVVVLYLRDNVVRPNIPGKKLAERLLPYFLNTFFFILILNLFGLVPGGHVATSGIGTTAALAIVAMFVINVNSLREAGVKNFFKHFLGGAPIYMAPIMIPVEIISLFAKPFALCVRLFANMTAGHAVLLSLIGLIFYFQTLVVAPVSIGFSVFVYCIELLVIFLQAFIFTILTAVFVGLAIGDHAHDDEAEGVQHA